ncbi:uncharacterized protein BDV17DRAFT_292445 [Aspergillus undulatus]|uniref:uncharacterized protein n=1 Tax=Aspergillus undulatus TaxID=1810928 RepID=UPI003CCD2EC9
MESYSMFRLQLSYLLKIPMTNLARKLEEKEDRDFRRLVRRCKKLGYGRCENGPDDDKVPEYYNLENAGEKLTLQRWDTGFDMNMVQVARSIYNNWKRLESHSLLKHPNSIFIRTRIDMLLQITTNEARALAHAHDQKWWKPKLNLKHITCKNGDHKQEQDQNAVKTENSPYNPLKLPGVDLINLTSKRRLSMPYTSNGTRYHFTGTIDHVVFSGDPEDLDASFVVLRAEKRGEVRVWTVLKMMAMIHHARKVAGKNNGNESDIYGLATDSHEFAFAHIDRKSRYSCWFLNWAKHNREIVTRIMEILEFAGDRAKSVVRAQARAQARSKGKATGLTSNLTASQLTGCRLYREDEFIYPALQESTENYLD